MKKIFHFLFISIIMISCDDLSDINKNPNQSSEASCQLMMPDIEFNIFKGEQQSSFALGYIFYSESRNESQFREWKRGEFEEYNILRQVQKMQTIATEHKHNNIIAISMFLKSFLYYNLSMKYGDIPYSKALKGETSKLFSPVYDKQKDVLTGILASLKQANDIIDIKKHINGDIIYGGDASKWKKLINSFSLRVLMSLSHKENIIMGTLSVKEQFAEIINNPSKYPLFASIEDDCRLKYNDHKNNRHYLYNNSWSQYIHISKFFVDLLKSHNDPRLYVYASPTIISLKDKLKTDNPNSYIGADATQYGLGINLIANGKISKINNRYKSSPSGMDNIVIGYSEINFILAEAAYRNWINKDVAEYYDIAIKTNMKFLNISKDKINHYIHDNKVSYTSHNGLKKIINQKYIASFMQHNWNSYFDRLRTEMPNITLSENESIAYRWMYPQSELDRNKANVDIAVDNQFGAKEYTYQKTWIYK